MLIIYVISQTDSRHILYSFDCDTPHTLRLIKRSLIYFVVTRVCVIGFYSFWQECFVKSRQLKHDIIFHVT